MLLKRTIGNRNDTKTIQNITEYSEGQLMRGLYISVPLSIDYIIKHLLSMTREVKQVDNGMDNCFMKYIRNLRASEYEHTCLRSSKSLIRAIC